MKNNFKRGFTLIEMAVVLLVIGTLAGIVLRNIGGQSAAARDTRRIGDLRNTANYLATYLAKFGYFPTTSQVGEGAWSNLEVVLRNARIVDRLPRDPSGRSYAYWACSDNNADANHFVLRATLEQTTSSAPRIWETAATSVSGLWRCWNSSNSSWDEFPDANCSPSSRYYCLIQ